MGAANSAGGFLSVPDNIDDEIPFGKTCSITMGIENITKRPEDPLLEECKIILKNLMYLDAITSKKKL